VEFPTATRISTATTFQIVRDRDGPRPRKTLKTNYSYPRPHVCSGRNSGFDCGGTAVQIGTWGSPNSLARQYRRCSLFQMESDAVRRGITICRKHLEWPKPH
jgi:hypothetical protein